VTDVNLGGAFACARAAEPALSENGGTLINVASVGGLVGLPRQHPYVASKHGLVGLTKSLALDWAPDVRVNCLAPGYVATDLTSELQENETLRRSIEERTPLDRFADPEEIAGPAVFLASDLASYATGATFAVDGGWTAR
jgi:NAD(P)-dependent dehydrogenase (short-subunit alcohol dehydrogenase family)